MSIIYIFDAFYLVISMLIIHHCTVWTYRLFACVTVVSELAFMLGTKFIFLSLDFLYTIYNVENLVKKSARNKLIDP